MTKALKWATGNWQKNRFYCPLPHWFDRELHFQSLGTGHFLSGRTHLAVDSCCGCLSDGTVRQAQKLTLPNQQTCQTTTTTTISVLIHSFIHSLYFTINQKYNNTIQKYIKDKYMLFTGWEVRHGRNCARGLENRPRP